MNGGARGASFLQAIGPRTIGGGHRDDHRVRLQRPEDVDGELLAWFDEARQVGDRRHLEAG